MSNPETNGHSVATGELVPAGEATPAEIAPARPGAAYADITPGAGERKEIIPAEWQRQNLRATLARHGGLHWHRFKWHGVRVHLHGFHLLAYTVRGAVVLAGKILRWWHWTDGWLLESQAVAAGRAGHSDAMRAHTEGKKTRGQRGRILGVCVVAVAAGVLAMVRWSPWWGWLLLALALMVFLVPHGKPQGKPLLGSAVVGPEFERVTPDLIVRALGSLGISAINQWLKDGKEISFVAPGVGRDGPGWRAELDLPYGVAVGEVLDRRERLAASLRRPLGCVWPEAGDDHAGRLVLYICDQPISKQRQPLWPLARAGKGDLFQPVPFGTDQRGRPVALLLAFANLLIGSIPRMGKTVAMRIALLAAALDVLAQLHVWELKGTGDLGPLQKVAHRYGSGADDETVGAALADLRQVAEVELVRRAKTIRELPREICPESKVTPELAAKRGLGLHWLVFGIDECQEAFSHPDYGSDFERYALQVIKRGPALGVILLLATQRPDAKSLPPGITANVSMRFCLRVMDQVANDMVLGTSAYKNGVRATLMTVNDKGCGYLVGAADVPQIVKTYNIQGPGAERIADRARVMRQQAGRLSGYALGAVDDEDARSFAADVVSVFGADSKLWTETIASRLAALIPEAYADITPEAVASQLRGLSVPVKKVREPGREPRMGCDLTAVRAVAGE